jgi:hypothetical protein
MKGERNVGYELITVNNCNTIKEILINTGLIGNIEITSQNLDLDLVIDSVSIPIKDEDFIDMEKVYFMFEESTSVLKIKEREYELFFNLGEWGSRERRIPNSHLVLGTNPIKFGSDYFCQIELSQAVEDEENIYIIKNISKLAGEGAISRLNNGLGNDKARKHKRREELIERLDLEVISYDDNDWCCVYKIDKDKLNNETYYEEIFHEFMYSFLMYALTIESIVAEE